MGVAGGKAISSISPAPATVMESSPMQHDLSDDELEALTLVARQIT
jgi:hypothetical protein